MKLQELGAQRPTEHIAKTLNTHMGHKIDFDRITMEQAQIMLARTQKLLREWRSSVSRHYSERNPDYIKLVMVEQALTQRMSEQVPGVAAATAGVQVDPARQAALATAQQQQKKRDIQDQIKMKQKEIQDLQRAMNMPTMMAEKKSAKNSRRLREASEINQAQVVLAAQDMVDQMQKMMEQISSMQFKDLPALTDAIKNDMGMDQASQFQSQASAALNNLLQAVQAGKSELEAAQGVLTGQAPQVPGADAGAMPAAGAPAAGGDIEADLELDANLPPEEEEEEIGGAALGRERR